MSISFVILTWNSQGDIEECINSIVEKCNGENLEYEIRIVDNGSKDETLSMIRSFAEQDKNIKYELLGKNFGTTQPRNIALKKAKNDFICVIDSDTRQLDGKLKDLLGQFDQDPAIGLIAPQLILLDKSIQHSVKKFPTLADKLLKSIKIFGLGKYYQNDFYPDFPFSEIRPVDTAISACWFFKRELLMQIGFLDEKIFYAPEDVDYSLRIWKAGKKIVYYPNYRIYHKTKQLSHVKPFSRISMSHFIGLLYYFRKHKYWFSRNKIYQKYINIWGNNV